MYRQRRHRRGTVLFGIDGSNADVDVDVRIDIWPAALPPGDLRRRKLRRPTPPYPHISWCCAGVELPICCVWWQLCVPAMTAVCRGLSVWRKHAG